jgi:hypothetical protein
VRQTLDKTQGVAACGGIALRIASVTAERKSLLGMNQHV